jgi:soluble lytic murein transglycosylase-like protein
MPTTLALILIAATNTFNLPPGLLSAVCYTESKHNPKAIHKDDGTENSLGMCQLHHSTAKELGYKGTAAGLLDAKVNVTYAAKYLQRQLKRYHGDTRKAVAAYNAGTYRENQKGEIMNRKYVSKVFTAWSEGK